MEGKDLKHAEGETFFQKAISVFEDDSGNYNESAKFMAEQLLFRHYDLVKKFGAWDLPYDEAYSVIKVKTIKLVNDLNRRMNG
jgi:hypothetical protein